MAVIPADRIDVVVNTVETGARDIRIYTLGRADGDALPAYEPGAHVALFLPNGMVRHYSLLPGDSDRRFAVAVKRDDSGRGGSLWIHDNLAVGSRLAIHPPQNNFPLRDNAARSVLFAGGIGITPIYAMATKLKSLGADFHLYYAARGIEHAIFYDELIAWPNATLHLEPGTFLPMEKIMSAAAEGTQFYCCGPAPMLTAFREAGRAATIASHDLHVEYFSQSESASTEGGFTVELARSKKQVVVMPGETILQALLAAGIEADYSCEEGICGTCECTVLEGLPDHRDSILSDEQSSENRTMMICCSGSLSKRLVLEL